MNPEPEGPDAFESFHTDGALCGSDADHGLVFSILFTATLLKVLFSM